MAANLERFKGRLEELINDGEALYYAMQRAISKNGDFDKQVQKQLGKEKAKIFLDKLPSFTTAFEPWYSESLALLKQLLPDRVANFVSLYEKPKARKAVEYGNYVMQDYLQGLVVTYLGEEKVGPSAALSQFQQQLAILKAAKVRFESALFEITQIVQADLFDSEIESARELLKNKFIRASGPIAGVVLEKHLHQVCADHSLAISKRHPGISDLNELLKANSVIDVPQWRHIVFMADIRNLCDHNKKVEPTPEQVTDLLDGTAKVLKTIS